MNFMEISEKPFSFYGSQVEKFEEDDPKQYAGIFEEYFGYDISLSTANLDIAHGPGKWWLCIYTTRDTSA